MRASVPARNVSIRSLMTTPPAAPAASNRSATCASIQRVGPTFLADHVEIGAARLHLAGSGRFGEGVRQPTRQDLFQLGWTHGFAQVVVHTGCQTGFAVTAHRVGGHGDDRDVSIGRRGAADDAGGLEPIHHRHLAVQQHQCKCVRSFDEGVHRCATVSDSLDRITEPFELQDGQALVDRVVLRQQDTRALDRGFQAQPRSPPGDRLRVGGRQGGR